MPDVEKVLKGWERCEKCNFASLLGDQKPYLECEYTVGLYCGKDRLIRETIELLKEYQQLQGWAQGHGLTMCKDCKRYYANGGNCDQVLAEWFCADGEKRE